MSADETHNEKNYGGFTQRRLIVMSVSGVEGGVEGSRTRHPTPSREFSSFPSSLFSTPSLPPLPLSFLPVFFFFFPIPLVAIKYTGHTIHHLNHF